MADTDELRDWLRLTRASGVGPEATRRLLAACGSPAAVLGASPGLWREVAGRAAAAGLASRRTSDERADADWQATRAWQDADPGHRTVLAWGDAAYPPALLNSPDPPPLLWVAGDSAWLSAPSLAIVGSRHASTQGLDNARAFAAHLSQGGLTIVSGLASGIDGAAHEGALQGRGSTVAVVGCGLDIVYPRRHLRLSARIADAGALVSEHPPGTPPLAVHFPRRNRVIAGLSLGTLVVEAALSSGSLITARLALEANREVFAIPGSIHAPQSRGCLQLIQQGAKLVATVDDILHELPTGLWVAEPAPAAPTATQAVPDEADPLLRALGHDPVGLDALGARCGWPAAELQARLLALELDGQVARLPGGLFQRRGRG